MSDRELERLRFWQMVFAASFAASIASKHSTAYSAMMADESLEHWDMRFGPEHTKTV